MAESSQKKIKRVRPPRVHLEYDVEVGDAVEKRELPFVAGIMADLSGKPDKPLPKLKDRKFVDIDRDNFDEVMKAINPRVVLQVDNKLKNDGTSLNVELKFEEIEHFKPVNVVKQVEPLRKLYEARERLSDLITKLDGNDDLDQLLADVCKETEKSKLNELKQLTSKPEEDK